MSGECNRCGEHCLDCQCGKQEIPSKMKKFKEAGLIKDEKNSFFYQGKFFDNEQEFWDYVKDFSTRQTTAEDFESLFDMLKKDIWMNLSLRETKITNSELRDVLEETFLFFLGKCWRKMSP